METPRCRIRGSGQCRMQLRSLSLPTSAEQSPETSSNKKPGRPKASGKKSVKKLNFNKQIMPPSPTIRKRKTAEVAKEALCGWKKKTVSYLRPPDRSCEILSDNEILIAVRVMYKLRMEREGEALVDGASDKVETVDALMSRAAAYTGISKSMLYRMWSQWLESRGKKLPKSRANYKLSSERPTKLTRDDFGMVREHIMLTRMTVLPMAW